MATDLFRKVLCPTSDAPIGLEVARAKGAWIETTDGRRYLDLTAGIGVAAIGHGRPEVADAVRAQLERHAHVMVYGEYEQEAQTRLAERVTALLPDPIDQIFLTCTGTEAVEGALKLARKATGRTKLVAFEGSYHGDTMGALSVQGSRHYRAPFEPLVGPVEFLPFDDPDAITRIGDDVAGVIVEPVQGEGGIRVPDGSLLSSLRARCTEVGAVLIFDEVITGFGRTGRMFAMEHWDVVPDVVCLAKAMGGGLPLGGFAAGAPLLQTLWTDPPLAHVTTSGGNPVCCAAGLAAIDVLEKENLAERAFWAGRRLREGLDRMVGIGGAVEARGIGLMLGIRFANAKACRRFVELTLSKGLLLGWTLHCDDLVRITPPLILTDDEIDLALARMREALLEENG